MAITEFLMTLVENTWMVSLRTVKYILLGYILLGLQAKKPENLRQIVKSLEYSLEELVMARRKELVYGLLVSGLLAFYTETFLIPSILAGVFGIHSLYSLYRDRPDRQKRGGIIHIILLLVILSAVFTGIEILNSLSALYLFAVIFIKI